MQINPVFRSAYLKLSTGALCLQKRDPQKVCVTLKRPLPEAQGASWKQWLMKAPKTCSRGQVPAGLQEKGARCRQPIQRQA